MIRNKRIVVTGLGPLSAIGIGREAIWNSFLEGKTGLTLEDYKIGGEKLVSYYVHRIKNFKINDFGIEQNILKDIKAWKEQEEPIDLFYLLAVVKLALDDAKINYADPDKTKGIGLVLTHENPGLDQFYEELVNESYEILKGDKKNISKKEYLMEFYKRFDKRGYDLQTFMFVFHVAKVFNLHSYSIFLCNACASGLFALETAADVIRTGKCNTVIIAGSDHTDIFKYLWFKDLDMYAEDGKIKPFAKNRNGFVTGDGGAGIVLEDFDTAIKRKAHIYAEYLGGGFHLEGWKVAIPDMAGDSYKIAIETVLKNSKVSKEDIDLIIPHGVGTKVTDAYEAKAITDIFGKDPEKPLITAFKPYIGHNLGSTALLETAILLLSLQNNIIPPTLNSQIPDSNLNLYPVKEIIRKELKIVMKTACGFAGFNAAIIFRKIKS